MREARGAPAPRLSVEQFLPTLYGRDAVGNHALATREALRAEGLDCRIWAEDLDPRFRLSARRYRHYAARRWQREARSAVHLYQVSTGTDGLADFLLRRPEPLVAYYHNLTPPTFYDPFDGVAAEQLRRGRDELERLAGRLRIAFAASEFSARELRAAGVRDVRVVPPFTPVLRSPDRRHLRALRDSKRGLDLLFVGRVAPHKGHLRLLRTVALLRSELDVPTRLFVVGGPGPHSYMDSLLLTVGRLGLEGSVTFTGAVSDGRLLAHYEAADLFLSMSEHEGFGIPLLEAMRVGLPIVAYDGGAVGETLGGAGVVLESDETAVVAEVVARMRQDEDLRRQVAERQRARAVALDAVDRAGALAAALREVGEG
ncbi:MAG: glycosyltransferase [bacterium]|jgi:glycosyltransferase involved in cell wall biosynthesis|nr:glycosyltransferase [bacterium]